MLITPSRLSWLKSGLFWRTFFLLAFLITASMAAWVVSFRMIERTPRAKQIAAQVVSVVTITRTALTHSAPDLRRELLFDLASNEGIRIYALEETDVVEPPADTNLMPVISANVRAKLGNDTQFASKVNDIAGFWVSFKIDDDAYWLMLDRERIDRTSSAQWLGWGTMTLVLALFGAVFISRHINQPLARLTAAARAIGEGHHPESLPESGPTEIREANRSFNQMVDDLNRVESDRTVILAGISHDLRTPISRMLLEVEMANLPDEARDGMHADLAQMDAIIGQFLDYAKPTDTATFSRINVNHLLADIARDAMRLPDVRINTHFDTESEIHLMGNPVDLRRVLNNLIENGRRYGKNHDADFVEFDLVCRIENDQAIIDIADHGPGVPENEMERLLRPFTRLDTARGQANGAGLGLAIVERVVRRHGGGLRLYNRPDDGLAIEIKLPAV